ncbi:alanine--tRNA ligase-related protein, partial [Acinetobacter baumannii]
DATRGEGAVLAIYRGGDALDVANVGDEVVIILDQSPFYGESGGQVGDAGYLRAAGVTVEVRDTTKAGAHHLHQAVVTEGSLRVGDRVGAEV